MKNLTAGEKEILKYVVNYKKINGMSPTYREIKQGINTKSTEYVTSALEKLEQYGYIECFEKRSRSIIVKKFDFLN